MKNFERCVQNAGAPKVLCLPVAPTPAKPKAAGKCPAWLRLKSRCITQEMPEGHRKRGSGIAEEMELICPVVFLCARHTEAAFVPCCIPKGRDCDTA